VTYSVSRHSVLFIHLKHRTIRTVKALSEASKPIRLGDVPVCKVFGLHSAGLVLLNRSNTGDKSTGYVRSRGQKYCSYATPESMPITKVTRIFVYMIMLTVGASVERSHLSCQAVPYCHGYGNSVMCLTLNVPSTF
jgi:hypothetical protein